MMQEKKLQSVMAIHVVVYLLAMSAVILSIRAEGEENHLHLNSQVHFERLIYLETEMIEFCGQILTGEEELHEHDAHNFSDIYRFLNESRVKADQNLADVESISKNPLAIYHLKKRLMKHWPAILDRVEESELITKFSIAGQTLQTLKGLLHHEARVEEALDDILFLQRLYHVTTRSIVNGWLGTGRAPSFDADDIMKFAAAAVEKQENSLAMEYLVQGKDIPRNEQEEISYLGMVANLHLLTNEHERAKEIYQKILLLDPNNRGAKSNLQVLEMRKNDKEPDENDVGNEANDPQDEENDNKLSIAMLGKHCRGEVQKSIREASKLWCYDKHLALSNDTVKVEELNLFPRMVMIYDVLTERQMSSLIKYGTDYIWQSLTTPSQDSPCKFLHGEHNDASSYIDTATPTMDAIAMKFQNMTYQTIFRWTDESDILSWMTVSNMGAGGKSDPVIKEKHLLYTVYDSLRIAHFHTFLNKPEAGGSIVFPSLKVKVDPQPGASLFWQFRTPRGPVLPQFRQYIECPVLYGTQWVGRSTVEHYNLIDQVRF